MSIQMLTEKQIHAERLAFEEWHIKRYSPLELTFHRGVRGGYWMSSVNTRWQAWLARAELAYVHSDS
jgi:hypothetical protein